MIIIPVPPLDLFSYGVPILRLYIQRAVLTFRSAWYESELKYLDEQIAAVSNDLTTGDEIEKPAIPKAPSAERKP